MPKKNIVRIIHVPYNNQGKGCDFMAGKNFAILRTEKLNRNKVQEIKRRCEHVNRIKYAENVNQAMSNQNRCVIGENSSDWYQLFRERYKQLDYYKQKDSRKLRSDAVIGIEAVATMSHGFSDNIDIGQWVEANNKWMQQYFGKENVIHGVLHMDEATPHIHYFITPVKDGRFSAREVMGDKHEYSERQTEYAKAMEQFGLQRGLQRGSRANYVELSGLYAEVKNVVDLPDTGISESAEEYRARINPEYRGLQTRLTLLERENADYKLTQDYATSLEKQMYQLQVEFKELKEKEQKLEYESKHRTVGDLCIENIQYTIENYPDKDTLAAYLDVIGQLDEWGKSQRNDGEFEHKDELKDIDRTS